MDGSTRCIQFSEKKQEKIMEELSAVLRMQSGVPFKRLEKLLGKLRHAAIGIPAKKNLFGDLNRILAEKPKLVFWDRRPAARHNLADWKQFIREAGSEPTHVRELVQAEADIVKTLGASSEGAGGVWLLGEIPFEPTVWSVEWPQDIRNRLVTQDNPEGDINNSDLEMAAEVLGWLQHHSKC